MRDAILVSPNAAQWPEAARPILRGAGVHVVRLGDLAMIGILLVTGDVDLVLVDRRSLSPAWRAHLAELAGLTPRTRVVIVRDRDDPATADDAVPWPEDKAAVMDLVGVDG